MTTQTITRQRLRDYIDTMPDYGLSIVEPILAHFADELFIDTNLTAEEKAVIIAGRKERKEHPESFTPWAAIKAGE